MTFAQVYENLSSKGFIKPLDPTPMPNPIPPIWNLNEYCHFHQKSDHKTDNCLIRKDPFPDYHRDPPPYQNWVQIDEIEWDCSKLIETVKVNTVEVQGI